RAEYARVLSEWEANGRRLPPRSAEGSAPDITVNEVAAAYWRHVESYLRQGRPAHLRTARRPPGPPLRQGAVRAHPGAGLRPAGPQGGAPEAHRPRRHPQGQGGGPSDGPGALGSEAAAAGPGPPECGPPTYQADFAPKPWL